MRYVLGFGWGIILLAGFAGWGLAVRRILRIGADEDSPDWGLSIVLGMSWIIALGGFLNISRIMTSGVVLTLVLAGLILLAVGVWQLRSRRGWSGVSDWPRTKIELATCIACLLNYGAYVCLSFSPYTDPGVRQRFTINPWDDLKGGYLTLPLRLLSEGNLGDDPFNSNRSLALGGLSLLQAFPLSTLIPTYVHVLDPGLAILALPLVLHGLGRRRGWPDWLAAVLTLFCLVLRSPRVSSSASLLPTLFLLSAYGMLEDLAIKQRVRTFDLCELALVTVALMTLKNSLVPGTCLILGIYLVLDWIVRRDLHRSIVSGLTAGSIILLLLAPWFVSSYRAAGTPLYPLLGEGYWANSMVKMPRPAPLHDLASEAREYSSFVKDPRLLLFCLMGILGFVASLRRDLWRSRGIAYVAVVLGSTPVLLLYTRTFPVDGMRYSYNYLTLVLLTSFALLLGEEAGRSWLHGLLPGGPRWVGGLLVGLTLAGGLYHCRYIPRTLEMVANEITGKGWDPNSELSSYRRLQSSIPAGQKFLAFLPMAHLLDFRRNPINVVDGMCGISPPPGVPLSRGPEDVAQYLRELGIQRIASREKTWFPGGETRDPEDLRHWSDRCEDSWMRSVVYSNYLMTNCVHSLAVSYETTRFENDLVLIDLDRSRVARGDTRWWRAKRTVASTGHAPVRPEGGQH
jgi:hypothetical protein